MRQKREKTTAEIGVDLAKKTAYVIPSTAVRPTTVEPFLVPAKQEKEHLS